MATYTNTIIIKSKAITDASELLLKLNLDSLLIEQSKKISDENIGYYESLNAEGIAIGFWEDYIILSGKRITRYIYDAVNPKGSIKQFEFLKKVFPESDMLLSFSNDTEMSFVLVLFKNGEPVRRKNVFHNKVDNRFDFGDLLPSEVEYYTPLKSYAYTDSKELREYISGYNDINIALSEIESFCGKMPDFDNLKMNVGINEKLGTDTIFAINEPFESEQERLDRITLVINNEFLPLKLKLRKNKEISKDDIRFSLSRQWYKLGSVLKKNSQLQVAIVPIVECSFEISVEIILIVRILDLSDAEKINRKLPEELAILCYSNRHINKKQDFEKLLIDLDFNIKEHIIPIFKSDISNIFEEIEKYFYNIEYVKMLVQQAERNKQRRDRDYPYTSGFDGLSILDNLRGILQLEDKEEVAEYFTNYIEQYPGLIEIPNGDSNYLKAHYDKMFVRIKRSYVFS